MRHRWWQPVRASVLYHASSQVLMIIIIKLYLCTVKYVCAWNIAIECNGQWILVTGETNAAATGRIELKLLRR